MTPFDDPRIGLRDLSPGGRRPRRWPRAGGVGATGQLQPGKGLAGTLCRG